MSLTAEQMQLRLGKFNASTIEKLCKPKGLGSTGLSYINQKAAELLTGLIKPIFTSPAMQWGIDHEKEALQLFCAYKNIVAIECNTIVKGLISGTPDAVFENNDYGGIEIKCPESERHIEFLSMLNGDCLKDVEPIYYWQIQTYMYLTDTNKWYFVSYDPRILVDEKVMVIYTINRNNEDIELLLQRVEIASKILKNITE